MKTIRLPFFFLAALAMLGLGCESILNVTPQSQITGQVFFSSEGDFSTYVAGMYTQVRGLPNNVTYALERSDELTQGINARFTTAWSQNLSPSLGAIDYTAWYSLIGNVNLFLKKADEFQFTNETTKKRLQAEALCLRAFTYFHLTRIIGDAVIIKDPVLDESVPQLPRSPAPEVMKQIFADLDQALSLFPDASYTSKYRFTKPAANALKAEAKLWNAKVNGGGTADYTDALTALAEVEKSGVSLLPNFRDITNRANAEIVLSFYFNRYETGATMYANAGLVLLNYSAAATNVAELPTSVDPSYAQSAFQVSPQIRALFDKYPDDKRKVATYIWELSGTKQVYAWPTKYLGTKYSDDRVPDDDLMVYRFGEILLMKAEALAGLGRVAEALVEMNKVRTRAGIPAFNTADKKVFERELFDERERELFYEGKRWYDIVRFHFGGIINAYDVVPNLKGKTTPLFWPLNSSLLARNPALKQTQGY